jgi:ribosome recycling factor
MPPLTEERRKQLVHHVKELCEQQRVSLRNLRRDILKKADAAKKEHALTEDEHKKFDKSISDLLKEAEKKIDEAFKKKSDEVLAI